MNKGREKAKERMEQNCNTILLRRARPGSKGFDLHRALQTPVLDGYSLQEMRLYFYFLDSLLTENKTLKVSYQYLADIFCGAKTGIIDGFRSLRARGVIEVVDEKLKMYKFIPC